MDLTIYTYGHMDAMYYVLNGIAMIMNSTFTDLLIKAAALTSTVYYALKSVYANGGAAGRQHLVKIAGMIMVINMLLVPRTSMMVVDHVTKQKEVIDNLPYGFAVPVGFLEGFGDALTSGFEQAFTVPGNTFYRDYGMVFGARLIQEARNWRIKSPELAENMDGFIKRCVAIDASIGTKYTINDLLTTDNIWRLVSSKASPLRRVGIKQGKDYDLVTCKEAASIIGGSFSSEIDQILAKYKSSDFSLASSLKTIFTPRGAVTPNSYLKKNIELIYGDYLGSTNSAEATLKQYMMMNAMSGYDSPYGYARASMMQESNWRIAGNLASTYLPILLSVMKGLIYTSFVFMVPLMLLSGGVHKYLGYLTVVASLQLWPALSSILSMFIDLYSASNLKDITGGIISFTSYSKVGDYSDKITAVASSLQMAVPFLAFSLVQGGVSGFIHLAGNITGASQSAASGAAGEVTSGNRSFDNYSSGNLQTQSQSGFKTDLNSGFRMGAGEMQHVDGTIMRTMVDGNMIMQSGTGINLSGGSSRLSLRESANNQISRDYSQAQSALESDSASFHEAERSTFGKTASYVAQLAQRESSGERFDYSKAGENGKSLQQAVINVRGLHENYGYGWDQAANTALKGGVNAGFSKPSGGGLFSGGVSGGLEGSVSLGNSSNQIFGDDSQLNKEQATRLDYNAVVRAAASEEFARSNNLDRSYSDDIRQSYEKQQSLERQVVASTENVERYSEALSEINAKDASYDRDMYHTLEQRLTDNYNVSSKDAHDMIENNDPRARRAWDDIVSSEVRKLSAPTGMEMRAKNFMSPNINKHERQDALEEKYRGKVDGDYSSDIKYESSKDGINPFNKEFVKNTTESKVDSVIGKSEDKIISASLQNEQVAKDRQTQIHKMEDDRIGQGFVAKNIVGSLTSAIGQGEIGGPRNPNTPMSSSEERTVHSEGKAALSKGLGESTTSASAESSSKSKPKNVREVARQISPSKKGE